MGAPLAPDQLAEFVTVTQAMKERAVIIVLPARIEAYMVGDLALQPYRLAKRDRRNHGAGFVGNVDPVRAAALKRMSVDESKRDAWREMQESNDRRERDAAGAGEQPPLKGGDDGSTYEPMEGRVSKLEAYMAESRADSREIRNDLKAILATMATKRDVATWKWQWIAVSVALFAVIVGSIIGGLGFLAAILER